MKSESASEKPLISILMAVYKPKKKWLAEQLDSLNSQDYPNLELIVCDDCPECPVDERVFEKYIKKFPFSIVRNDENLGSNKTFERLTTLGAGEYFAYCDQDDIWLPNKLSKLYGVITEENSLLACSDVIVINAAGDVIADSLSKVRRRHIFYQGDNLFGYLLSRNFVLGCTSLVRRDIALRAVPFIDEMVHDHWIALCASFYGKISVAPEHLVKYRLHGGNQTGVLINIDSKDKYIYERIDCFHNRVINISKRLGANDSINEILSWIEARKNYSEKIKGSAARIWELRRLNKATSFFELLCMPMPNALFSLALKIVKKY